MASFPFLTLLIAASALLPYIHLRQYLFVQNMELPSVLKSDLPQKIFEKRKADAQKDARIGLIYETWFSIQHVIFIQFGFLNTLWLWTGAFIRCFSPRFTDQITHSLVFVFAFNFLYQVILPFTIYYLVGIYEQTFKPRLNLVEPTFVLGPLLLAAHLAVTQDVSSMYILLLIPILAYCRGCGPVTFERATQDVENDENKKFQHSSRDIETIAKQLGYPDNYTFSMPEGCVDDANPYALISDGFHIVLPETFLQHSTAAEVKAVLALTLGYWHLGYLSGIMSRVMLWSYPVCEFIFVPVLINSDVFYSNFGLSTEHPVVLRFMLLSYSLRVMMSLVPKNIWRRRGAFQADAFAKAKGCSKEVAQLHIKSCHVVDADWIYDRYCIWDSTLTKRIEALG